MKVELNAAAICWNLPNAHRQLRTIQLVALVTSMVSAPRLRQLASSHGKSSAGRLCVMTVLWHRTLPDFQKLDCSQLWLQENLPLLDLVSLLMMEQSCDHQTRHTPSPTSPSSDSSAPPHILISLLTR
jgi:hypothetical protein